MEFFNKTRWSVSKLSDQVQYKPDQAFSLPIKVFDTVGYKLPTTITCKLVKVVGRTITTLPTVVTVTDNKNGEYSITATPTTAEWNGTDTLQLHTNINSGNVIIVPLVVMQ